MPLGSKPLGSAALGNIETVAAPTATATKRTYMTRSGRVVTVRQNISYMSASGQIINSNNLIIGAELSGTITLSVNEADIVAGGNIITLILLGDTFVAEGSAFDAQRQAIIDGMRGL